MAEDIKIKRGTLKLFGFLIVAFVIGVFVGQGLNYPLTGAEISVPDTQIPEEPTIVEVSEDDDPSLGSADAPVVIVEFSDFQCPFCGRFSAETFPLIKENYIDTGKVRLVYRDLPLPFHPDAQETAEAAECADDQGKFWEYHDAIFENQDSLDTTSLKQYAKDIGLNTEDFNSCLDSGKHTQEVKKDFSDAGAAGVTGTPTFFINGIKVVGAQPYSVFQQIIESELN
jgi:protein-disulfide isomerase